MTGLQGAEAVFIKATFYYWAKYEKLDWLEGVAFLFEWNQTKKIIKGSVRPSSLQDIRCYYYWCRETIPFMLFYQILFPSVSFKTSVVC